MNEFNVFVEINAIKSITGHDDGPWVFEGIASTSDIDLFDEVVYPESFSQSLDFFKSNGKIFFDHDYAKENDTWLMKHGFDKEEILALKGPIGKPTDVKITPEGLYIKGVLNKEHPMARLMWNKYLNNKDSEFHDTIGLSIGARYLGAPRKEYDTKKGKFITYLPDLLLYEVSMTPEPVNPHTRTWASVLKSLLADNRKEEHHVIEPSSVLYDAKSGKLVVKSVVEGGDGIVHVFEQYVDIKEDIRNMQSEDEKVTLKALPEEEEQKEEPAAAEESAAPEKTEEASASPAEGAVPGLPEGGLADLAAPEAEGAPEAAGAPAPGGAPVGGAPDPMAAADPLAGGAPEGGAPMGGDPMGGGEAPADGAGSVLDSLVSGGSMGGELGTDPMAGDSDASMDMLLDKQDTILDLLGQLLDALQGSSIEQANPAEQQVTQEAPSTELLKSFNSDNIKEAVKEALSGDNVVNLSEESTRGLGEAIKSALVDFEDRVVEKIVLKMRNETTLVKKSVDAQVQIKNPGVQIGGTVTNVDSKVTLKSVLPVAETEVDIDIDTVRSYASEYVAIKGSTPSAAQQRAHVVERALNSLNISELEFRALVNKIDRGQL